jgi:hypothetical protein
MVGVCCRLELLHLLAANPVFLADSLDPMDPDLNAMLGEIGL